MHRKTIYSKMSEGYGKVLGMEDKVVFEVTRSQVESIVGSSLADNQWRAMSVEIADLLDYYTKDEVPRLFDDIDSILAEQED